MEKSKPMSHLMNRCFTLIKVPQGASRNGIEALRASVKLDLLACMVVLKFYLTHNKWIGTLNYSSWERAVLQM